MGYDGPKRNLGGLELKIQEWNVAQKKFKKLYRIFKPFLPIVPVKLIF